MKTKAEHLEYLKQKGPFDLEGDTAIFNNEEIQLLQQWGHWYNGLSSGELIPFTELQRRFVSVMKGEFDPFSLDEHAWFRYLGRKRVKEQKGDRFNPQHHIEDDNFYSREMVKMQRSTMFKVMSENHRK
jgi:uncharacterized protein